MSKLLERAGDPVQVPGATRFVLGEKQLRAANIDSVGPTFKCVFLGKVEENVGQASLVGDTLTKSSKDVSIIAELGERLESSLVHMLAIIRKQKGGWMGILWTIGRGNVFYIQGKDKKLWPIRVRWLRGCECWDVEAFSLDDPRGWPSGDRIFSRATVPQAL